MMKTKKRLDTCVQERYPQYSRTQIQSFIMQGAVAVNGTLETKAGTAIKESDEITVTIETPKYVCRAGQKLEHALEHFGINPAGLVILDAGLSTGGFTDCLLQQGAARIYGIDVGYGQVHEKIRHDARVTVLERTNLRSVLPETLGNPVIDLVTLDLSFISLLKVIHVIYALLKPHGQLVTLIKPQFEAERHQVGRGGIIKDPAVHQAVIERVTQEIELSGFILQGVTPSPIEGASGNKEFLAYFIKS
jgi:23S rRNA (cytidine1920-2'-O)/16S rRNA (cytidine1409-2'-O)-methyltransferase